MANKKDPKRIVAVVILGLLTVPVISYSRVNSLTGGIGTSYDYSVRTYDDGQNDSDYQSIALRPMLDFVSTSERDRLQLRVAPALKYDLENEETDWDSSVMVAADRFVTKRWQLQFSDTFVRSDYYDEDTNFASRPLDPSLERPEISDPALSTDLGRKRYWKNSLNLSSTHFYQQESSVGVGFNYIALRNDDSGSRGYDDYDRYVLSLTDVHRFNPIWQTRAKFDYVIGNYDESPDIFLPSATDQLSRDLSEYRLMLNVDNNSIVHNPLSLYYSYIRTNYDASLRDDISLHQLRLTWMREFSPRLYTRLGAGPSYSKADNGDANWGANGVAELNYLLERGFINFKVEKSYEVDNFSGNYERGSTDTWDSSFSFQYQLQQNLRASGSLSYLYEDRQNQFSDIVVIADEYHRDVYIAGLGLGYNFWRNYTAGIDYEYINQDSERDFDSYDEHRILLTLSWQKELYRW